MIDYKNIASAVDKFSPLVASAINETNPILGTILVAITRSFNSDVPSLPNAISTNPDALSKIKSIENFYYDDLMKQYADDIKDARAREVDIVKLTKKRDYILDIIAFIVVIGYFAMCMTLEYIKLDQSDHDVLYMMVGQLTAGFIMVLSYYFGSTNRQ
jgi:hypothetical protein